MAETRKLAAILAADVVGYSRLMGEDEAGTARAVRERREAAGPIIAGHGGRIVKTMGDGLLLEFPSVVAAVECAIAIQKLMVARNADTPENKRIVYRIGVNLGDVLIEGDDILSDGVNIAARLEGLCEPGGVLISGSAFDQVLGRIDANFVDQGERQLKNIARPVHAYALQVGALPAPMSAAPTPATPKSAAREIRRAEKASDPLRPLRRTMIVAFLIVVAGWRFIETHPIAGLTTPAPVAATSPAPAAAGLFSIVVLPLANLSGDAGQDYLVDALTDELTTSISRIPDSFVIASNTAFTYKGKPIDVKAIGKDLGVKYALEGSVQPTANRVRVNAQLIDAESGAHLWAESFDEDRADLLQMEDEIVTRLARTVGIQMIAVEAARAARARPENPDAQDLALRCLAAALGNSEGAGDPSQHPEIYEPCERALALDPHNGFALAILTSRLLRRMTLGEVVDSAAEVRRFDDLATQALAIDPNDVDVHLAKATLAFIRGRYDQVLLETDRVIELNPSLIPAYELACGAANMIGQADRTIAYADKAQRLSPRDPARLNCLLQKGLALSILGRDPEAIDALDRALGVSPDDRQALRMRPAFLAMAGRDDEAREAYRRYAAFPGKQIRTIAEYKAYLAHFMASNAPALVAWRARYLEGLREAGMPEQ